MLFGFGSPSKDILLVALKDKLVFMDKSIINCVKNGIMPSQK